MSSLAALAPSSQFAGCARFQSSVVSHQLHSSHGQLGFTLWGTGHWNWELGSGNLRLATRDLGTGLPVQQAVVGEIGDHGVGVVAEKHHRSAACGTELPGEHNVLDTVRVESEGGRCKLDLCRW